MEVLSKYLDKKIDSIEDEQDDKLVRKKTVIKEAFDQKKSSLIS